MKTPPWEPTEKEFKLERYLIWQRLAQMNPSIVIPDPRLEKKEPSGVSGGEFNTDEEPQAEPSLNGQLALFGLDPSYSDLNI